MRTQRTILRSCCSLLLAAALAPPAYSEDRSAPEPAVVTSSAARSVPSATRTQAPRPPAVPGAAGVPGAARVPGAAGAPVAATAPIATPARTQDRIELEATQISGNRELPKVMYVVPWRKPDLGDFSGRPPNSLLDEALEPLDRDVFRRQNRYYASVASEAAAPASPPGASGSAAAAPVTQDEK